VKEKSIATFHQLRDIFACHPEADYKLTDMVDIAIRPNPLNRKTHSIYIVRYDGTELIISWRVCITPHTQKDYLVKALRRSISSQILVFKAKYLNEHSQCGICRIGTGKEVHIDHVTPFVELVKDFHVSWNHPIPVTFAESPDGIGPVFQEEDMKYRIAWEEYHEKHASLRITCPGCNLQRKRSMPSIEQSPLDA
jgi:hypothetical protein